MAGSSALPNFPLDVRTGSGIRAVREGAAWRFDLNDQPILTTGTDATFRVATEARLTNLRNGLTVTIQADRDFVGAPVIGIDSVPPVPWVDIDGAALTRVVKGRVYRLSYDSALGRMRSDVLSVVGNGNLGPMAPATLKGNPGAANGAPQDIPLSQIAAPGNAIGDAITARPVAEQVGSPLSVLLYASLAAADAVASSAGRTLLFPSGFGVLVPGSVVLTSPVRFDDDATISVSAGQTLTLNGPVSAPDKPIFRGAGAVAGTFGGQALNALWWGAAPGVVSAANDAALDAAVLAAAVARVPLDFRGLTFTRSSLVNYTAAGLYDWRNGAIQKTTVSTTTDGETTVTFTGSAFGPAIPLTADAVVGAPTLAVAGDAAIIAGKRYLLCSAALYNESAGSAAGHKSEFLTPRLYSAGTVTLASNTQSSYATANSASLFLFDPNITLSFVNFRIIGGGPGAVGNGTIGQVGVTAIQCRVARMRQVRSENNWTRGFQFTCCAFDEDLDVSGFGANRSGFGYLVCFSGCDAPRVGNIVGDACRHVVTGGSVTSGLTLAGIPIKVLCRGGRIGNVHGTNGLSSVFDTHAGWIGPVVGNVTGTIRSDTPQAAVTLQGPDTRIGTVIVSGAVTGALIQHFGKPLDEMPSTIVVVGIDAGTITASGGTAGLIQNGDAGLSKFVVEIGSMVGTAPALISARSTLGTTAGGNVDVRIRSLSGKCTGTHGVFTTPSATGKVNCIIDALDIEDATGLASLFAVFNAGTASLPNGKISIREGSIVKSGAVASSYAMRALNGLIELGADVAVSGATNFKLTGSGGEVYRVSRAVAAA